MAMMRVLVTGCRDWPDDGRVFDWLAQLESKEGPLIVIHGGAGGADEQAGEFARSKCNARGRELEFLAEWGRMGKAAGPLRNQRMIDEGKPERVMAFWDGESRGTHDMIKRAVRAGVPVRIIPRREDL